MLLDQRRAVNSAAAPQGGLGGQELEFAMMVADGTKTGEADPAFEAHMSVAMHWAQAIWNTWLNVEELHACIEYARARIEAASSPWAVVTGPAAALICTLDRLDWKVVNATELTADEGKTIDLRVTPPIIVKRMVEAAVRRWRWRNVVAEHPSLNDGGAFCPVLKLLTLKRNDAEWNLELRGMLRSVVTNRQFRSGCFVFTPLSLGRRLWLPTPAGKPKGGGLANTPVEALRTRRTRAAQRACRSRRARAAR